MLAMVCRGYKNTLDVGNYIFKKLPKQTIFLFIKMLCFCRFEFSEKALLQYLQACLFALMWHLPSMCIHVGFKFWILRESFVTIIALIWLLPSVCNLMPSKITIIWEIIFTITKLLWHLPSLCHYMTLKTTIFWER